MGTWLKAWVHGEANRWIIATCLAASAFAFDAVVPWLDPPEKPTVYRIVAAIFIVGSAAAAIWAIVARDKGWHLQREISPGDMITGAAGWKGDEGGVVPVFGEADPDGKYRRLLPCRDVQLNKRRCRVEFEICLLKGTTVELDLLSVEGRNQTGYHFYLLSDGLYVSWRGRPTGRYPFQYLPGGSLLPEGKAQCISISEVRGELSLRMGEHTAFTLLDGAHLSRIDLGDGLVLVATSESRAVTPWIGPLRVYK